MHSMADEFNLMLEHLKALRADSRDVKRELSGMREELTGIRHHMSGFLSHEALQDEEIAVLKQRLERVETRLNIFE